MEEGEGPAILLPRPVLGTFETPPAVAPRAGHKETPSSTQRQQQGQRQPQPQPQPRQSTSPSSSNNGSGTTDGDIDGVTGNATTPAFLAARIACGQSHTVIVSTGGEAWACGRNRSGQLGVDPEKLAEIAFPVRVALSLPSMFDEGSDVGCPDGAVRGAGNGEATGGVPGGGGGAGVVQAAAGRAHTMLLLSDGRVVGFGSDEFGALGFSPGEGGVARGEGGGEREVGGGGVEASVARSWHWRPREIEALRGKWVASVSAGGEQSFALVVDSSPSPSPPPLPLPLPRPPSATAMPPAAVAHGSAGGVEAATTAAAAVASSSSTRGEGRIAAAGPDAATGEDYVGVDGDASRATAAAVAATAEAEAVRRGAEEGAGSRSGESLSAIVTALPVVRQGSEAMFLRRSFSLPPSLMMRTAVEFLELIQRARDGGAGEGEGQGGGGRGAGPAEAAVIEVGKEAVCEGVGGGGGGATLKHIVP